MEDDEAASDEEPEQQAQPVDVMEEVPTISFHAMQGRAIPRTLRLEATLAGRQVLVLVDGGSTHNFVQTRVAKNAGLMVEAAKHLSVTVGNGEELRCEGRCRDVELLLGGKVFRIDFYLLPIYGVDVVLGAQWLAEVGPVMFDYKELWLNIDYEGEELRMHGVQPMGQMTSMTLGGFKRAQDTDSIMTLYHMLVTEVTPSDCGLYVTLPCIPEGLDAAQTYSVEGVLARYAQVFGEPQSLPPSRTCDHKITLTSGAEPVSVRPYRYPRYQKLEMERLIETMLKEGLIRPKTSPFSSPVLLLHGAKWFSKLDLREGYHQILLAATDVYKTAFRTHDAHYEFLVMPFGITNAPSTFQAAMNNLLRPLLRKCVLVFMDDILVYSRSWEDHMNDLGTVLEMLMQHKYLVKALTDACRQSKCTNKFISPLLATLLLGSKW
ncbi:unnamed protein product [Rhodiola kirilowii]